MRPPNHALVILAVVLAGCARQEQEELVAVAEPPPSHVEPPPTPSVSAPVLPAPSPSVLPKWTLPPKQLVFAHRLALSLATHGIDGRLDVFRETQDETFPLVDVVLKLVPKSDAATNLTFKNAQDPTVLVERFGDAARSSIALEYDVRWVTGSLRQVVVVEVENDKLVWRHATHPVTGERRAVEVVLATFSGASVSAGRVRTSEGGGAELLQVGCGMAKPKNTCTSVNRVFYVREGKWWWAEREGTACKPKTNGWCAAAAAFPDRSEFPAP